MLLCFYRIKEYKAYDLYKSFESNINCSHSRMKELNLCSIRQSEKYICVAITYIYEQCSVKRGFNACASSLVSDKPVQSAHAYQGRHFPRLR